MGTQKTAANSGLNEAVVLGQLVADPEFRDLPSGSQVASFSLTVRRPGEKTTSVPMGWIDPPEQLRTWQVGEIVVCRGQVVRRFYQAGGGLGSATEVVVRHAALARHKRRAQKVLAFSSIEIDSLAERLASGDVD